MPRPQLWPAIFVDGKPNWYVPKPEDEVDWEAIRKKDELMLRSHYSKSALYANVPSKLDSESRVNLGDKRLLCVLSHAHFTILNSVFENGHGEQHRIVLLSKAQQARGMNWVLERFSVPFRVNGKR